MKPWQAALTLDNIRRTSVKYREMPFAPGRI